MRKAIGLLILSLLAFSSFSQNTTDFRRVIEESNTDFAALDSLLKHVRGDSEKLIGFISLAEKSNYKEGLAYAHIQLGINQRNVSEYPEAILSLKRALKYAEQCQNIDFRVIAMNMLGVVHRRKEEIREALDYHKQALELAENVEIKTSTGIRNIAVARNSIGNIYISLRQPELAEKEFLASVKIEQQTGNKLGLAINYQNLGSIYEERGDLDSALLYYQRSLDYNREIDSDLGRVICFNSIGHVFLKQNRFKEALKIIQPTLAMAEEVGDQYYVCMANLNYGWALFEEGNLKDSEKYIRVSLKLSNVRNMGYFVAESYKLLAQINEKKGNFREALKLYKLFNEKEKEYLNESNQQYVADLILKYDSDRKRNQIDILKKENEIANLKLADNRKLFIISAICLSLLAGLAYFLYHQSILRKEKEYLALEQKMMRSQMNPHFIFNSLNSIKLYIINSEKDKAVYFLNKFSKLIRTILASSKEKDITLQEELDTMELYMSIENLRFSNKINFKLEVEEDLPTKAIRVPSMILQPFLENAIWHGLSSKEGDKMIRLTVFQHSKTGFTIEIEDNGIGREKSREIKAQKTLNDKSIGLDLTEQRLDNYYKNLKGDYSLEIIDLKDAHGNPEGTQINLKMPYCFEV